MLVFVEHDESGNLTHVCEVHTSEGPDAPPPVSEPIEESPIAEERARAREERARARKNRELRVAELIAEREEVTKEQIRDLMRGGKKIHLLPDGASVPSIEHDKFDAKAGRIRPMTAKEKADRAAAAQSTAA